MESIDEKNEQKHKDVKEVADIHEEEEVFLNQSKHPEKRKGGRVNPEDWDDDELLERLSRIGKFDVVHTKVGNKKGDLTVVGRRIFGETWMTLKELMRRNPDIREIKFINCFITDETFSIILESVKSLSRLEVLNLSSNLMTLNSVNLYINEVKNLPQGAKLDVLDFRDNHIHYNGGKQLYDAFPNISELNGIQIAKNKVVSRSKSALKNPIFTFTSKNISPIEVMIICCLVKDCPYVEALDLSRNSISCDGIHILAKFIKKSNKSVRSLDISWNPVTESTTEEHTKDYSGIEYFLKVLKESHFLCNLSCNNCKIPMDIEQSLLCSVQVNRSLRGQRDRQEDYFPNYCMEQAQSRATPMPKDPLGDWMPPMQVDMSFAKRLNIMKLNEVQMNGDNIVLVNRFLFLKEKYDY